MVIVESQQSGGAWNRNDGLTAMRYDYTRHFAVGVVAGSSVLGMIIPPSVMMIIYAFVAEQSVAHMFIAGILPGLLLATTFVGVIMLMTAFAPKFIGAGAFTKHVEDDDLMAVGEMIWKLVPLVLLILVVLIAFPQISLVLL